MTDPMPITRVAVIVPAHDEAGLIGACLAAIDDAVAFARALGKQVEVYVVCDACRDGTEALVRAAGHRAIVVEARNVGHARAVGARVAIAAGAQWLAFTDADTLVSATWLVDQLALQADAFCGTVGVHDWGAYGERMERHWAATYRDADGHAHVHGANFGIATTAYEGVGGFRSLACSEDVAIVEALRAAGYRIAFSAVPRVITSIRGDYRAPGGFGATLQRVAAAQEVEARVGGLGP